jgi:hypothetical protein
MYMQRVTIYPKPENIGQLRTLLAERVKMRQGAGIRSALTELVAGGETPQFSVAVMFDDLAAYEAFRKRDMADAEFQKFVGQIATLIRKPTAFDLLDVLVPMPS